MMQKPTYISWSTGKDSAWATYQLQQDSSVSIQGILCTVNAQFKRTAMHAVRIELLQRQAAALNLPLQLLEIPYPCNNEQYLEVMQKANDALVEKGVEYLCFGDLFLEDVRQYRIDNLKNTGINPVFPLWQKDTTELANEMIQGGVKAIVTCIDPKVLDKRFVGREYNHQFIADLPNGVDPCGENGEFHTFVYQGPMFETNIKVKAGEVVERDGFVFADVSLANLNDS
ncbi:adenine nucleotide alpha hydrolase [Reinekea forsetii]|nr:adenine nucleotide alpha hydrolase [Reinekea forsetii]